MLEIVAQPLKQLYHDWQIRQRGRDFPSRADFDPLDLAYIIGDLSLLDVLFEPGRYRYRIHATNMAAWFGYDLTGKELDDCPVPDRRERIRNRFNEVISTRAPTVFKVDKMVSGRPLVTRETLILPLSSDGVRIDILMNAVMISGRRMPAPLQHPL